MGSKLFCKSVLCALWTMSSMSVLSGSTSYAQETSASKPKTVVAPAKGTAPVQSCAPGNVVWGQSLPSLLGPTGTFPTARPMDDCDFHQWSWETFLWATAMVPAAPGSTVSVPRFLTLATISDLFNPNFKASQTRTNPVTLSLGTRVHGGGSGPNVENAGAIVEADGNILVAQDGYPVYASVHMNASYFNTAQQNMIYNGNYLKNKGSGENDSADSFATGAVVFKATWRRYDGTAPAHSYTTQANVPVLAYANGVVTPAQDSNGNVITKKVNVALVGLHVVGRTDAHPEFVWGTFEQKENAPMVKDGAFNFNCPSPNTGNCQDMDTKNYTFYQANTPFTKVNLPTVPFPATGQPMVMFDSTTQKFYPPTQVVQANRTGGDNSPNGVANIDALNVAGQSFVAQQGTQAVFQNYNLIGTVWMEHDTYTRKNPNWQNLNNNNAIGSVNLANSTAETFQQVVPLGNPQKSNCFMCHNPTSFGDTQGATISAPSAGASGLPARLIALSHVLAAKSSQAVPNSVPAYNGPACTVVKAGPIWSNAEAQNVCRKTCGTSATSYWNGQWVTTQAGVQSVCQCCHN